MWKPFNPETDTDALVPGRLIMSIYSSVITVITESPEPNTGQVKGLCMYNMEDRTVTTGEIRAISIDTIEMERVKLDEVNVGDEVYVPDFGTEAQYDYKYVASTIHDKGHHVWDNRPSYSVLVNENLHLGPRRINEDRKGYVTIFRKHPFGDRPRSVVLGSTKVDPHHMTVDIATEDFMNLRNKNMMICSLSHRGERLFAKVRNARGGGFLDFRLFDTMMESNMRSRYMSIGVCGTIVLPQPEELPKAEEVIVLTNVLFEDDSYKPGVTARVVEIDEDGNVVLLDLEDGDIFTDRIDLFGNTLNGAWGTWGTLGRLTEGKHPVRKKSVKVGDWIKVRQSRIDLSGKVVKSRSGSNDRLSGTGYGMLAIGGNLVTQIQFSANSEWEYIDPMYDDSFDPEAEVISNWDFYKGKSLDQIKKEIWEFSLNMCSEDNNCVSGTNSFLHEMDLPLLKENADGYLRRGQTFPMKKIDTKEATKSDVEKYMRVARDYLCNNRPVGASKVEKYLSHFHMQRATRKQVVIMTVRVELDEGAMPSPEWVKDALRLDGEFSNVMSKVTKVTMRSAGTGAK